MSFESLGARLNPDDSEQKPKWPTEDLDSGIASRLGGNLKTETEPEVSHEGVDTETSQIPEEELAVKHDYNRVVEGVSEEVAPVLDQMSLRFAFDEIEEAVANAVRNPSDATMANVEGAIQALRGAAAHLQGQLHDVVGKVGELNVSTAVSVAEQILQTATDEQQRNRIQPLVDEANSLKNEARLLGTQGVELLDHTISDGTRALMSGLDSAKQTGGDFSYLRTSLRHLEDDYYANFEPLRMRSLQAFGAARGRIKTEQNAY